jgi:hypothetical protein
MILIIVVAVLLLIGAASAFNGVKRIGAENERNEAWFKKHNYVTRKGISVGKYVTGYPEKYEPIEDVIMIIHDGCANFFRKTTTDGIASRGVRISIPIDAIHSIEVLDQTTMEKKVTLARLMVLGLFAFAAKKQQRQTWVYLVIKCNLQNFDCDVVFESTEENGLQQYNKVKFEIAKNQQTLK